MKKSIDFEAKELLIQTIDTIRGEENIREFLNDLFSSAEVKDLSRRLMCAKLLFENNTYQQITQLMGMSANTINKIHFKTRGSKLLRKIL